MKIERGMHTAKHRLRLMIVSEDVEAHSYLCDNEEYFKSVADNLAMVGKANIEELENAQENETKKDDEVQF